MTYGIYTTGGGSSLPFSQKKIFKNTINETVIKQTMTIIWQDLNRMNLSQALPKMSVLNVGSGTEAIAFKKMGAKEVTLYDLSPQNIQRTKDYSIKNHIKIYSEQIDLLGKKLN